MAEAAAAGVEIEEVYVEVGATVPDVGSVPVVEVAAGVLARVLDARAARDRR